MDNKFVIFIIVLVIGLFGYLVYTREAGEDIDRDVRSANIKGSGESGVTLTEYGDFGCAGCRQYYPTLKQVADHYGDRITIQWKHLVIPVSTNSLIGAKAAQAAGEQGKFWEMHDLLFDNFDQWREERNPQTFFNQWAKDLGLDVERFRADMVSRKINSMVQNDSNEARDLGASATPSFAINGELISTPRDSVDSFVKVIDEAIADLGQGTDDTEVESKDSDTPEAKPEEEPEE